MFRKILGPSPLLLGIKKVQSHLFFRGGTENENGVCLSDEAFYEIMNESISNPDKARRLNPKEVQDLLSTKAKLTKEQRLLKSRMAVLQPQ